MKHFLTFGMVFLVLIGCGKEKELEVDSGIADSTQCLFYINGHLKQEGKSNYFTHEIVKGDSLLIYKSYTFLGNQKWVDIDTSRIAYYEPEKIVVNIGD